MSTALNNITSRSVAALLNISRETGSIVFSIEVDLGFEGLLDGPSGSPAYGFVVGLDSSIGVNCNPVIEVDGARRVCQQQLGVEL